MTTKEAFAYVGHWSPWQAADWHVFVAVATSDSELPVPEYIATDLLQQSEQSAWPSLFTSVRLFPRHTHLTTSCAKWNTAQQRWRLQLVESLLLRGTCCLFVPRSSNWKSTMNIFKAVVLFTKTALELVDSYGRGWPKIKKQL